MHHLSLSLALLAAAVTFACSSPDAGSGEPDVPASDAVVLPEGQNPDGQGDAPDAPDADVPPPDHKAETAACTEGERVCLSETDLAECKLGAWVTQTVCTGDYFCSGGTCVLKGECTPGDIQGCYSLAALNQCNEKGTGYVPVNCEGGKKCINGTCLIPACLPGESKCIDSSTVQTCLEDGSMWGTPEACPQGLTCVGGKCMSECLSDPKWNNSYIGCEYWAADLDNYPDPTTPTSPDEAIWGLILGNPGTAPAKVTFTTNAVGIDYYLPEVELAPGEVKEVAMPRMDLDGTGIFDRTMRINSNRPILAYQFNPLDFQQTYSDDSSLLLPAEMLGNEYFILTLPTTPLEVMPMVNMPSQHGYFAVLAVEPGDTQVTIQVSCKTDPVIAGGEMLKPGNTYTFTLEQFEVIQIEATGKELAVNDLSGSHIIADRKVAVFAGHEEAVVQLPDVEESCCCAEHIEEQLFPLDTWDTRYYAAKAKPRGPSDKDLWRVQAGAVNVKLTTNPPIDGIHGKTLAKKGDWVEAYTAQSFIVEGTGPIQVGQYLASQTCTDEFIGDPALIMAVSAGQYRTHYVFAAPKDYDEDYIGIVRQTGSTITLDGSPVNVPFTPFADGAYEVGYVEVQDGPHIIDGDFPFGLVQYGWDGPASYGNPGGLNLIKKQQD